MGEIIDINELIRTNPAYQIGVRKKDVPLVKIKNKRIDSFEKSPKEEPVKKGLTLEEMSELVGKEETEKLFASIFDGPKAFTLDFTSKGSKPLSVSLKKVWDFSKKAKEEKLQKADEISRTRKALRRFERICSTRYQEVYGKEADIRLKLSTTNKMGEKETVHITDALLEQQEFYRKNKIMATVHLMKERMDYLDEMERFKDYFEDNYLSE